MAAPPHRPITISIVSHGQQALILPLLSQLDRLCATSIAQVVLTVNIPEHDLVDASAYRFPIRRLVNEQPHGFGTNHNAAFSHCATEWFLVLNPDIRIDGDVLQPLLSMTGKTHGVRAPRIVEPGKTAPEPHRGLLTPREILVRNRAGYGPPVQPTWIPGMFMLFRSAAYRQVQGFDRRYFMYGEDFDICARLQLAGWTIGVNEQTHVLHDAQRASHRSKRHLYWHFSSLLKVWSSRAFWRYALRRKK